MDPKQNFPLKAEGLFSEVAAEHSDICFCQWSCDRSGLRGRKRAILNCH